MNWLALELVDQWKGWGTVFCCYLSLLQDSLVTESGCSCGQTVLGYKNLSSSCWQLSFLVILSADANTNMLPLQE